jgi:RHS repeat-associated protein
MPQDLDGDCDVDIVDIMMVASRWGCQCGDDCYDYDFDSDCWITVADIMQVAAHWREPCPEELVETVKYYTLGGRRVAMRKVPADPPGQVGTLYYLFSDHLGSSSVSYRTSDGQTITQRYYPWGAIRPGPDNALPTDYTFTGQKLDESTGLMYYGARYYDPALGRFISADPIVPEPGNSQALNRYSYVYNNPLRYTDPTGHQPGWIGRARRYVHWWTGPGSPLYNLEVFGRSLRSINNSAGDAAIKGLDAEIERAAQDAEVPTILLAAALHHQGGSPKWMDQIADLGLKSPENVSRGIGQITIGEAERFNRDDLVLDPVPDETLAEALYIPEVSVRYMAAKLKESARLIDRYLDDPDYSTISLSEENRWLLLMPAQNIGKGSVIRFFDVCGGDWSCWFADPGIYSQVLYIRDDIAWLEEHGWTE